MTSLIQDDKRIVTIGFDDTDSFVHTTRVARVLMNAQCVPKSFLSDGRKGQIGGDAALARVTWGLVAARSIGIDCIIFMSNIYFIHGSPSQSAKLLISCFNQCRRFSPISYKFTGKANTDSWSCVATAISKSSGKTIRGAKVSIEMAKKEGWLGKSGSKWQTMPELMLQYRAATFLIRTHAPEISLGFQTKEEVEYINFSNQPKEIKTINTDTEVLECVNDEVELIKSVETEIETKEVNTQKEVIESSISKYDHPKQYDTASSLEIDMLENENYMLENEN